jgi:hypothetical protein
LITIRDGETEYKTRRGRNKYQVKISRKKNMTESGKNGINGTERGKARKGKGIEGERKLKGLGHKIEFDKNE